MKDPEIDELIHGLETRTDLSVADFDGVTKCLAFLLPERTLDPKLAEHLPTADAALHLADDAFPNWAVHIHGRANEADGKWRCTLRESDARDNDAVMGSGRSPVLGQAILAAILRLTLSMKPG